MSRHPSRHGASDANQKDIVSALESIGASVVDLHTVGNACPDILVGYQQRNYLMEIKTLGGHLTNGQLEFMHTWRGQTCVVRSVVEAFQVIGLVI